jgi:hypothetical protein
MNWIELDCSSDLKMDWTRLVVSLDTVGSGSSKGVWTTRIVCLLEGTQGKRQTFVEGHKKIEK